MPSGAEPRPSSATPGGRPGIRGGVLLHPDDGHRRRDEAPPGLAEANIEALGAARGFGGGSSGPGRLRNHRVRTLGAPRGGHVWCGGGRPLHGRPRREIGDPVGGRRGSDARSRLGVRDGELTCGNVCATRCGASGDGRREVRATAGRPRRAPASGPKCARDSVRRKPVHAAEPTTP